MIYASCMYHPTYKDYKGQMDDLLCDPSTKVFVYEDQGRKTGMIILKFSDAAAEIIGIAVSVDARRKGIGKQLIRRVMELDDLECVKAQTDDDSIGFYRKCGFSEEKIVIEYPDGKKQMPGSLPMKRSHKVGIRISPNIWQDSRISLRENVFH